MGDLTPALSADEWREVRKAEDGDYNKAPTIYHLTVPRMDRPDAIAALALHDQPFGFTRDDVWNLRNIPNVPLEVLHLADRIEALLPPEE